MEGIRDSEIANIDESLSHGGSLPIMEIVHLSTYVCSMLTWEVSLDDEERKRRRREYQAEYRRQNAEKIKASQAEYRAKNQDLIRRLRSDYIESGRHSERTKKYLENPERREAARAASVKWREENPDKSKKCSDVYRAENPEKVWIGTKKWRAANPDKVRSYAKAWSEKNREKLSAYQRERRRSDVQVRIRHNLRTRLKRALKGMKKPGAAIRDLGCTIPDFCIYIEARFTEGMSWSNYGLWHLDHVRPLVSFDLTDEQQYKIAAHHTNYQPLWAVDNLRKGRRY